MELMADKSRKPSATACVLKLYELLDNILYHVYPPYDFHHWKNDGVKQYAGLMRVNKLWFSVAIKYVWGTLGDKERPYRSSLELVDDQNHLQAYAKCVENLKWWDAPGLGLSQEQMTKRNYTITERLPKIELPRLRRLVVDSRAIQECLSSSKSALHVYLRDSLTHLQLYGEAAPPSFWMLLTNTCPNIETFCQHESIPDRPSDSAAREAFQEFLESTKKLRKVSLYGCAQYDMLRTLKCCAQMPLLSNLSSENGRDFIGEGWIRQVLDIKLDAFRGLTELCLSTTNAGLTLLESNLESLRRLKVNIKPEPGQNSRPYLNTFSHSPHLQALYVTFSINNDDREGIIDGEELIRLGQHCPKLKRLWINGPSMNCSDSVVKTVSSLLPDLEECVWQIDCPSLTEQGRLHFGRYCKSLRDLTIYGTVDLAKFARVEEAALFPNLMDLTVSPAMISLDGNGGNDERILRMNSHEEACAFPSRISLMMPKLRDMSCYSETIEIPASGANEKTLYELWWAFNEIFEYGRDPFTSNIGGRFPTQEQLDAEFPRLAGDDEAANDEAANNEATNDEAAEGEAAEDEAAG